MQLLYAKLGLESLFKNIRKSNKVVLRYLKNILVYATVDCHTLKSH